MNRKLLKLVSILVIGLLLLVPVLSGCGSQKADSSATSGAATTTAAAPAATTAPAAPVTLTMIEHANSATNEAIKAFNDKFTAKYPNITVESTIGDDDSTKQLTQTRIAANNVDIVEINCFAITTPDWTKGMDKEANAQYIENGDILDLTGQPFLANWDPAAIKDACTYKGKVYNLDIGKVGYNGIFYNKKIFADNGLSVPGTWDEFINICKTLQGKGIAPMTVGAKEGWPVVIVMADAVINANEPDVQAFAKGLWTGERKFNDPQTLKEFDKMAEFESYLEKGVSSVDCATAISRFAAGKAAMLPDGTWSDPDIRNAGPDFEYGYFCVPGDVKGSEPVQLAGKYDTGYGGVARSAHTAEILKWMEFFSQKDNYTEFVNAIGFIPAMKDITINNAFMKSLDPINQNFQINSENILKFYPKGMGQYGGFMINKLKVLGGPIATAKELADLAQKDFDTALAAANK